MATSCPNVAFDNVAGCRQLERDMEYTTMIFIWLIGWGVACGAHYSACEAINESFKISQYLTLLLFWPHYIGYSIVK